MKEMSIKVEKTDKKNEVKLSFTIEAAKFEEAMQKVYLKSAKYFNIPGFRKGKAPYKIAEKMYGPQIFYEDAFNELVPEIYEKELNENKIEAVSRPNIDITQMEKGKDLIFTAVVQTKPEVTLGKYKGIEIKKVDYTVKDEDIDHEIGHMQERNARLVNIDPKLLVSLYKENVQKVVSEQAYAQKNNQSAEASMAVKKLVKAALIAIIVIGAIAFGVSYFASGSEEESSGALVIEDTVQATTDNDGSLSIDTENSKMKSNMVPVEDLPAVEDPNTQLAKKQAMSMDTNAIISNQNEKANGEVSDAQDSLVLKGQAAVNANNGAAIIEEEPLLEENTLKTVSIDDGKVSYKDSKNQKKDTLSLKTENTTVKTEKLKE